MNTDKAYLLGLILGGGRFGISANRDSALSIRLPLKNWGAYSKHVHRAGQIADDILRKVNPMFCAIYNVSVHYETTRSGIWTILCVGDVSEIKEDFSRYGIECEGEIREHADISALVRDLVDDNLKRRFIAGLADTIGSVTKSHRRFTDERQIVSFEIKGYNFSLVCSLCRLLYSINCIPDQVTWNHPNIHCTNDPYYKQWNKGFKLRILLDQYAEFGAFAFKTKAEAAREHRKLQQQTHSATKCEESEIRVTPSTVHPAEKDVRLPSSIRGGHYIHFRHFCAVLGCEHAPYNQINSHLNNIGELIIPFPILCKGDSEYIEEIINGNILLKQRTYDVSQIRVKFLLDKYNVDRYYLLYGNGRNSGYPIAEVLQAAAYVIAREGDLFGRRCRGGYVELVEHYLDEDPNLSVKVHKPDLLTPLLITANDKSALVGAQNPDVYKKLVSKATSNHYKLIVREITEDDLRNA